MRTAVYNRYWPTAGGGERFAAGIAEVLAEDHEVTLLAHEPVDLAWLGERLQLDLGAVAVEVIGPSPEEITAAGGRYDLFVNASYSSDDRCRAPHGIYVVHFPTLPPFRAGPRRKAAIGAAARVARLTGADPAPATWQRGAYMAELAGWLPQRWTVGDAAFTVPAGTRRVDLLVSRAVPTAVVDQQVEVRVAGSLLARATVAPRRSRWQGLWQRIRLTVPAALVSDGGAVEVEVRSSTFRPAELAPARDGTPAGPVDDRVLGAAVVGVLTGGWARRAAQTAYQVLAVPTISAGFLDGYQTVASNSAFTQRWVRELWGRNGPVLYPPVIAQPPGEKAPVILGVGRFFPPGTGHSKRQRELVEAFRRLAASGWSLHLVGGCDAAGEAYLADVRAAAEGLEVHLHVNASGAELRGLYAQASIFWHATGLGEDERAHPDRFEHFGITTVEAMSAGVVPVVIGRAGQLELFESGRAGFHAADLDEMIAHTRTLITDPQRRAELSVAAAQAAERFERPAFAARLRALVAETVAQPANR
jgi:glycosyltransferase involved in cell wall biosynthesis